jgi:hypothetical protein
MAYLRRKAIYAGVLGGSRKWMIWGGAAWVLHVFRRVVGAGEPVPRYTHALKAGQTLEIVHESQSPLAVRKAAKRDRRTHRADPPQAS